MWSVNFAKLFEQEWLPLREIAAFFTKEPHPPNLCLPAMKR